MWYTIQSSDDWLSKIAGRYLGDVMLYPQIYDANRDILTKGPDHIEQGMKIWIPIDGKPKPFSTEAASSGAVIASTAPTAVKDKNKIMIAGGSVLGIAALALLFSKKK